MSFKKAGKILAIVLFFCLAAANAVRAGFGISPPYVRSDNLVRGSHYEQKIILVREKPGEDWKVALAVDVPKAENWISVDKGKEFIMPKGEQQVPIIVRVDVPQSAEYGNYKGKILVSTGTANAPEAGKVTIALGGQIDVDLTVGEAGIFEFKVRSIKVSDTEARHKTLFGYVGGKIGFSMQIENTGNIEAAPTKVRLDIYDAEKKELLESPETAAAEKVKPFETKWITAELQTKLTAGSYWAEYKIFKNEEAVNEGEVHLSIMPAAVQPVSIVHQFNGITLKEQISFILWRLIVLVAMSYGSYKGYVWYRKRSKAS